MVSTLVNIQKVSILNATERYDIIATTASVAASTLKPFGMQEREVYDPMIPVGQDQVGTILSSVSNTLHPIYFVDALINNVVCSCIAIENVCWCNKCVTS